MLAQKDLEEQREAIQHDIISYLDGLDDDVISGVCQIVVDRFEILISKLSAES